MLRVSEVGLKSPVACLCYVIVFFLRAVVLLFVCFWRGLPYKNPRKQR